MFRRRMKIYLIHIILLDVYAFAAMYTSKFSMLLTGILLVLAAISLAWLLYNSVDRR